MKITALLNKDTPATVNPPAPPPDGGPLTPATLLAARSDLTEAFPFQLQITPNFSYTLTVPPRTQRDAHLRDQTVLNWLAGLTPADYKLNCVLAGGNPAIECKRHDGARPEIKLFLDHNRWLQSCQVIHENASSDWFNHVYFEAKDTPPIYRPGWHVQRQILASSSGLSQKHKTPPASPEGQPSLKQVRFTQDEAEAGTVLLELSNNEGKGKGKEKELPPSPIKGNRLQHEYINSRHQETEAGMPSSVIRTESPLHTEQSETDKLQPDSLLNSPKTGGVAVHKDGVYALLIDPATNMPSTITAHAFYGHFVPPVGELRDGASPDEIKKHKARLNTQNIAYSALEQLDAFLERKSKAFAFIMQTRGKFVEYRDAFLRKNPHGATPLNTLRNIGFTLQAQDAFMLLLRPGATDPLAPDWTRQEKHKLTIAADLDEYLHDKNTSFQSLLAKKQGNERAAAAEFVGYQRDMLSSPKYEYNPHANSTLSQLRTAHFPHELEAEFQGWFDNRNTDVVLKPKMDNVIGAWKVSLTRIFDELLENGISGDHFKTDLQNYQGKDEGYRRGDNLVHDLKLVASENMKNGNARCSLDKYTSAVLSWLAARVKSGTSHTGS